MMNALRLALIMTFAMSCIPTVCAQDTPRNREGQSGSPTSAADEVPMLRELPLLSFFFRSAARFPLDGLFVSIGSAADPADHAGVAARPTKGTPLLSAEAWLAEVVRRACPGIELVEFEATRVRRYGGGTETTTTKHDMLIRGSQTAKVAVGEFLDRLGLQRHATIVIKSRILSREIAADRLEPSPDKFERVDAARAAALARRFDESAADKTLSVSAPSLTVYTGQEASISIGETLSYIKDYDVELVQCAFIADPIISTLWQGMALTAVAFIGPDGKTVTMDFSLLHTVVDSPIESAELKMPVGTTVKIELPRQQMNRWNSGPIVLGPDERDVYLSGFQLWDGKRFVEHEILLHLDIVRPTTAGPACVIALGDAESVVIRDVDAALGDGLRPGEPLVAVRENVSVAKLEIVEVEGRVYLAKRIDGQAVRIGDTVRRP